MIKKLHLIYFSPSGSTEKIVKEIASVIEGLPVETHNLLTSGSRKQKYKFAPDDLVIMGSISAGKLFTLSEELFDCLEADNTPFIGVISYGNAYYGIALKEMLERAEKCGFKVAGLGAFIARYSIDMTIGRGRPDEHDKGLMHNFGRRAYEKVLRGDLTLHEMPKTSWGEWDKSRELIAFREKHPEVPYTLPPEYKAKAISDECIKCKTCVKNCPVDAINIESKTFDLDKCIGCWGCINRCPKHAITSTSQEFADIVKSFCASAVKRLEPDIFF